MKDANFQHFSNGVFYQATHFTQAHGRHLSLAAPYCSPGLDAEGLKDDSGSKGSGMATKTLVCKGRNELGSSASTNIKRSSRKRKQRTGEGWKSHMPQSKQRELGQNKLGWQC